MSSRWADTTDDEEDYSQPPPSENVNAVQPQEVSLRRFLQAFQIAVFESQPCDFVDYGCVVYYNHQI